eukprot:m.20952 g.20952  ORF g.20952 m.20952 type:complete len:840 (+) comp28113_c0_seq2:181-2700(+)
MAVDVAHIFPKEDYSREDDYEDDEDAMDTRIAGGKKLRRLPIDRTQPNATARFETHSRVNRIGDSTVEGINKGVRVKVNKIYDGYGSTKFPRIEECAHFHYDQVNLGDDFWAELTGGELVDESDENIFAAFSVTVTARECSWTFVRTYEDFQGLDRQLHRCVFDRRFSSLRSLKTETKDSKRVHGYVEEKLTQLTAYLSRLSSMAASLISCGPILNWFEIDCKGRQLQLTSRSGINIPAVAAAKVIQSYSAQESDEVSLVLNEIVSIIDMPPESETTWWRGKAGFKVGFFPSSCVEVIQTSTPQRENTVGSLKSAGTNRRSTDNIKPVLAKRGKMLSRLRSVLRMRPSKEELQQSGILKSRVFGADLSEHLQNAGLEIPAVVRTCTEVLEQRGLVEGIYRLPGISSNINKLRQDFDANKIPDLNSQSYVNDINCVGSLCKMYFRELPNPLLTYQLYSSLEEASKTADGPKRREAIAKVLGQLPPTHFNTMEHLIKHLAKMASHSEETKMTPRNLAIVWAPNLMRPRDTGSNVLSIFTMAAPSIVVKSLIDDVIWYFGETGMAVMRSGAAAGRTLFPASFRSQTLAPQSAAGRYREGRQQTMSTFEKSSAATMPERRSKTTDDLLADQKLRKPPALAASYGGKSLKSLFSRNRGKSSYNVSKRPVISGPVGFVGAIPAAAADAKEIHGDVNLRDGRVKSQTLPLNSVYEDDSGIVRRRQTRLAAAFSAAFTRGSMAEQGLAQDVSVDEMPGKYRTLNGKYGSSLGSENGSESEVSPGVTLIDSPETERSVSMFELGRENGGAVKSTDIDSYMQKMQKMYRTPQSPNTVEDESDAIEFSQL